MVDQAQVNGAAPAEAAPHVVVRNTGELLQDLLTLGELQARLLIIDVREGTSRLLWPLVLLVVGAALALGCWPVALIALAMTLVEITTLTTAQAFGVALASGIVLTALVTGVGWSLLRQQTGLFDRSLSEWQQNVKWTKNAMRRLGRIPARAAETFSSASGF